MGLCNTIFTFLVFLLAPFAWYSIFAAFLAVYYPGHPLATMLVHDPIQSVRPLCDHCPAWLGSSLYKRPEIFVPEGLPNHPLPALLAWLVEESALVDNVEVSTFDGLRGLKAVGSIHDGQAALSVPFRCTLNAATFSARNSVQAATASWAKEEDASIFLTPLALLYETLVLKGKSTWAPFIATLPLEYTLPINLLDPRAKKMLAALPDLQRLTKEWRWLLVRFYPKFLEAFKKLPRGDEVLQGLRTPQLWNAYIWAYCASKTRSVTVLRDDLSEQDQAVLPSWVHDMGVMVPLLDMANHGADHHANVVFWTAGATATPSKPSRTSRDRLDVQLLATKDIHPGQQILPSYGGPEEDMDNMERLASQCDANWLLEYGFIIQDGNPERHCFAAHLHTRDLPLAGHSACALLGWTSQDKHSFKSSAQDGRAVEDLLKWAMGSSVSHLPEWAVVLGNKTLAAVGAEASLEVAVKDSSQGFDQVNDSDQGFDRVKDSDQGFDQVKHSEGQRLEWRVQHASRHGPACLRYILDMWAARLKQAKPEVRAEDAGGKNTFWGGEGCGSEKECVRMKDSVQEVGVQMLEQVVDGAVAAVLKAKEQLDALDRQQVLKLADF